jgi:hypothetical protein
MRAAAGSGGGGRRGGAGGRQGARGPATLASGCLAAHHGVGTPASRALLAFAPTSSRAGAARCQGAALLLVVDHGGRRCDRGARAVSCATASLLSAAGRRQHRTLPGQGHFARHPSPPHTLSKDAPRQERPRGRFGPVAPYCALQLPGGTWGHSPWGPPRRVGSKNGATQHPPSRQKQALARFELALPDSESGVITTTL